MYVSKTHSVAKMLLSIAEAVTYYVASVTRFFQFLTDFGLCRPKRSLKRSVWDTSSVKCLNRLECAQNVFHKGSNMFGPLALR